MYSRGSCGTGILGCGDAADSTCTKEITGSNQIICMPLGLKDVYYIYKRRGSSNGYWGKGGEYHLPCPPVPRGTR